MTTPDRKRGKILAGRIKFNELLNHVIAETRFNHALVLRGLNEQTSFTNLGNLSAAGQFLFWKEVDHMFKKFDQHKINLKPTQQDCGDHYDHTASL